MDGWMVLSSVFATYLLYSGVDWTGKVDKYVRIFLLPFNLITKEWEDFCNVTASTTFHRKLS